MYLFQLFFRNLKMLDFIGIWLIQNDSYMLYTFKEIRNTHTHSATIGFFILWTLKNINKFLPSRFCFYSNIRRKMKFYIYKSLNRSYLKNMLILLTIKISKRKRPETWINLCLCFWVFTFKKMQKKYYWKKRFLLKNPF